MRRRAAAHRRRSWHCSRGIQQIERVKLDAPAIGELIPHPAVDRIDGRRLKYAVLGERPRTDIAPAQRAEPAGSLAKRDARRRDHPWRFRNEISWRVADLRLRETGEQIEELLLSSIGADKARAAERKISIEAHPRHRLIIVGDLNAGAEARRTGYRGAGVTVEEQFRVLTQGEQADRAIETGHDLGAGADFDASRPHFQELAYAMAVAENPSVAVPWL